jgi:hypothetical protein
LIRRAEGKRKWLVHPDRTTVQLGDSHATVRPEVKFPSGDPSCNEIRFYSEAPDCYRLKDFEDAGYVIARSDWAIPADSASMLIARSGFFGRSHRHADDFGFEWFEQGRKLVSEGGKYANTGDEWDSYFHSTRAHNTIEIDGHDYSLEDNYGNAAKIVKKFYRGIILVLQVEHEDLGVWIRRRIDYHPGEDLEIKDTVRSGRRHIYVQWHHFSPAFALSGGAGGFELDDGDLLVDLKAVSSCGDDTEYSLIKGQLEPQIQGWTSPEDRVLHARWALGVTCEAKNATFEAHYVLGHR